MDRMAPFEHHEVGCVDEVAERALPERVQAIAQPKRRGPDLGAKKEGRTVSRTTIGIADFDFKRRALGARWGELDRGELKPLSESETKLSRKTQMTERVGAVRRQPKLKDRIADGERIDERRSRRNLAVRIEDKDAFAAFTDAQLALTAKHSGRLHPADLSGDDSEISWEDSTELRKDHLASGLWHIRRATDNLGLSL